MSKISEKESIVFVKYIQLLSTYLKLKDTKILDIGCATGNFIKNISKFTDNVYGVDSDSVAIEELKCNYKNVETLDLNDNIKKLPFDNIKFDVITMFDVIEHLDSFIQLQKILDNNLKIGGYFVITTPNGNSIERFLNLDSYSGEFDKTHKILFTKYTLDFFLRRKSLYKILMYTPYIFSFKPNLFNKNLPYGGQILGIYRKK